MIPSAPGPRTNLKRHLRRVLVAVSIGWYVFGSRAAGDATIYVDRSQSDCSDTGPGTAVTPYCSISAAVQSHGGPGTTILVLPATYPEQVNVTMSGTSVAPFVIKASGASVAVDGADPFSATSMWAQYSGSVYLATGVTWAPQQVWSFTFCGNRKSTLLSGSPVLAGRETISAAVG